MESVKLNGKFSKGLHPSKLCPTADCGVKSVHREVNFQRTAMIFRLVERNNKT